MYRPKFVQVSNGISVSVKPLYLSGESSPFIPKHVFAYFITIKNMGDRAVKLLSRKWKIHESSGKGHTIEGKGVIGVQPVIAPQDEHEYNSFCVLSSYKGRMTGYYIMEYGNGDKISVKVPQFLLVAHTLN